MVEMSDRLKVVAEVFKDVAVFKAEAEVRQALSVEVQLVDHEALQRLEQAPGVSVEGGVLTLDLVEALSHYDAYRENLRAKMQELEPHEVSTALGVITGGAGMFTLTKLFEDREGEAILSGAVAGGLVYYSGWHLATVYQETPHKFFQTGAGYFVGFTLGSMGYLVIYLLADMAIEGAVEASKYFFD